MLRLGAGALAAALLANCADIGAATSSRIHYDHGEHRIIGQATALGAIGGAGLGYLIAKNNGGHTGRAAILGGLAGGLAGNQVGKAQANKARAARLRNDQLRRMISTAKKNNQALIAFNRKTEQRIAAIRAAEASKRKAMAKAEISRIDHAQRETAKLRKERSIAMQQLKSGREKSQLKREMDTLDRENRKMARHKSQLARY